MPNNKNQIERLKQVNQKTAETEFFKNLEGKPVSETLRTQYQEVYNDFYTISLGLDHMSGQVRPVANQKKLLDLIGKYSEYSNDVHFFMPYTMNSLYAAHLDANNNAFQMSAATGTIFLLRDIALTYPESSYDDLVADDMIQELKNRPNDYHINALGTSLNAYAKAGKIDPQALLDNYKEMNESEYKAEIIADLAQSVPEIAVQAYQISKNCEDVKDINTNNLYSLYTMAQAINSDDAPSIAEEALRRMTHREEGNTYSRMLAAREVLKIMTDYPKNTHLEELSQNVITATRESLENALKYTPRDENQALNDYTEILGVIAERLPEKSAEILTLAEEIGTSVDEECAKPNRDYNWLLTTSTLVTVKEKASIARGKEPPEKTSFQKFQEGFTEISKDALLNGNGFGSPKGP